MYSRSPYPERPSGSTSRRAVSDDREPFRRFRLLDHLHVGNDRLELPFFSGCLCHDALSWAGHA